MRKILAVSTGILVLGLTPSDLASTAECESAGALKDGRMVAAVKLRSANGVSARIISYGATLQSLIAPDAKTRFTLDGQSYRLPLNNGANTLHGGGNCFDRQLWTAESVSDGPLASVILSRASRDGDSGYPGETYRHTMVLRVSTAK